MGVTLALVSAACFGLSSVCSRVGQRSRSRDDGHFMTVMMNVVLLLVVLPFSSGAAWSWTALIAFLLAGVATTWLGRATSLRAIRLIGPARQGAFLITSPVFTGIAGWVLLDETVHPLQLLGSAFVLGGLAVMVRSQVVAEALESAVSESPPRGEGVAGRRSLAAAFGNLDARRQGYAVAAASAASFGLGFVARKWGLEHYPNAVVGALVGALMSLTLIVGRGAITGNLRRIVQENLRDVPLWFVLAGSLSGLGLLLGFSAFLYLPAWAVAVLKGTQGPWTLLWSYLFLKQEDQINRQLLLAVSLVFLGIVVIAFAS